jgi:hypothetical protein
VLVHGVPYCALLWGYTRARAGEAGRRTLISLVATAGPWAFLGVLLACAFAEEALWDRFVWHDHDWLFGAGSELRSRMLAWVVPLLAVPQVSHYLLDGVLWRRAETRRLDAQRRALGFEPAGEAAA